MYMRESSGKLNCVEYSTDAVKGEEERKKGRYCTRDYLQAKSHFSPAFVLWAVAAAAAAKRKTLSALERGSALISLVFLVFFPCLTLYGAIRINN